MNGATAMGKKNVKTQQKKLGFQRSLQEEVICHPMINANANIPIHLQQLSNRSRCQESQHYFWTPAAFAWEHGVPESSADDKGVMIGPVSLKSHTLNHLSVRSGTR